MLDTLFCNHLTGPLGVCRLNLTTPGLIEAEVWTQTPASGFQPSTFWQKV